VDVHKGEGDGLSESGACLCGAGDGDRYRLSLYVSERLVAWPLDKLDRPLVASYSDVRQAYAHYIDHCRLHKLCAVSALYSSSSSSSSWVKFGFRFGG